VTTFLCEIPTGIIADLRSRRLSIIIGEILVGVCFVIEGSAPLFAAIVVAEIIRGVGLTCISGALEAWIADELGEARVREAFLRYGQVRQIGGLLGLGLGVGLATVSLTLPIILGGAAMIALGLALVATMPESGFRPVPPGERAGWRRRWGAARDTGLAGARLIRTAPVLPLLLATGVVSGAFGEGIDRLNEAHFLRNFTFPAADRLEPVVWFGLINVGTTILGLGAAEVIARRARTDGEAHAAAILLAFTALRVGAAIAFGLAGNFALALAAYWAIPVLGNVGAPIRRAWLNRQLTPQTRATVFSIYGQADSLGQLLGGPAIGLVGTLYGLRAAMVAAGLLLTPALLLYARALRRSVDKQ
jgi:DHA3 family tetracycline resistance protein-like MFS transporter